MTCPLGAPSGGISASGGRMELGNGSTRPCAPRCGRQWGENPLPVPLLSTANRCEDHRKRGPRGYAAGKKGTGRKRHIVVDTLGLLLAVVVHAASIQDRDGAKLVLTKLLGRFPRLQLIWADGAYAGKLIDWAYDVGSWLLLVNRPGDTHRFQVLPRRWVVERTLAWLGRCRRLSKDYEALPETSETWVQIAMIHLMLRRLKPA
jgi:putative transposase